MSNDRPYGSAARLIVYLRDHSLTYHDFGAQLDPPVTKGAVSAWTRQIAVPSPTYKRQCAARSNDFVPEAGWAPTTRDVESSRRLLSLAARVREEIAASDAQIVDAARVHEQATRVREEVKPVPKGSRQRWTRWQQQSLSV